MTTFAGCATSYEGGRTAEAVCEAWRERLRNPGDDRASMIDETEDRETFAAACE